MVLWVVSDKRSGSGFKAIFKFKLEDSVENEINNIFTNNYGSAKVEKAVVNGKSYFVVTEKNEDLHKEWSLNTKEIYYSICYRANDCFVFYDNQGGHFCIVELNKGVVRRGFCIATFGCPLDFIVFKRGIINCYGEIVLDEDADDYWETVEEDLESFGANDESIRFANEYKNGEDCILFNAKYFNEYDFELYKKAMETYELD